MFLGICRSVNGFSDLEFSKYRFHKSGKFVNFLNNYRNFENDLLHCRYNVCLVKNILIENPIQHRSLNCAFLLLYRAMYLRSGNVY